jgi:hypothetical protein
MVENSAEPASFRATWIHAGFFLFIPVQFLRVRWNATPECTMLLSEL